VKTYSVHSDISRRAEVGPRKAAVAAETSLRFIVNYRCF